MSYVDPESVVAPKSRWQLGRVLFSSGRGGWSICEGNWDDGPVLAIRWNGSDEDAGPGNPQSRGYPTWFVLPSELADQARKTALKLESDQKGVMCEVDSPDGYDPGAWKLTITLSPDVRANAPKELVFPIPRVPNGMCRGDTGYVCAIPNEGKTELWGKFVDGVWRGHLYVYGIDTDVSAAETVRDQLVQTVRTHLVPSSP